MREAPSASGTTHAQIPMIYRPQLRQTRRAGLSWPRPWTARIEPTRRTRRHGPSLRHAARRDRAAASGLEPAGNSPEEFAKVMHTDIEKWLRVTREAGIKPQ